MLAPISRRVPPRHYGPWERVVSLLTEGLIECGLEVTLFATADSTTRARLIGVSPRPYSEDPSLDPRVWESLHLAAVFARASEFDLIHSHFDFMPLPYCDLVKTPILTTLHGSTSAQTLPVYEKYNGRAHYVAISNADRKPTLDYIATIYHGISPDEFPLNREPGDYLLCLGRIHPEKGTAEAIKVARRARQRLIIAGVIEDMPYFEHEVAPQIDGENIQYLGAVGPDRRNELLGGAFALLHLINFDESFGLSVIEAMACGTPVIARGRGSVPELVVHEETGFIVNSIEEAVVALQSVRKLDREQIRLHVEQNFSRDRMVDEYIRVYMEVVKQAEAKAAAESAKTIASSPEPPKAIVLSMEPPAEIAASPEPVVAEASTPEPAEMSPSIPESLKAPGLEEEPPEERWLSPEPVEAKTSTPEPTGVSPLIPESLKAPAREEELPEKRWLSPELVVAKTSTPEPAEISPSIPESLKAPALEVEPAVETVLSPEPIKPRLLDIEAFQLPVYGPEPPKPTTPEPAVTKVSSPESLKPATAALAHDERPWGSFTVLDEGVEYKVKRIEVLPGKRLSYQRHKQRSEYWVVVQGTGKVKIDGEERLVRVGQKVNVPVAGAHRMENFGEQTLIFIEIQRGNYLGEDDIERLEDDYGRIPKKE